MMANLSMPDLERLERILGMLGSSHDGERAAAALKANELITNRGVTWADLIASLKSAGGVPAGGMLPHWSDAQECLRSSETWSDREADFLRNMTRKRKAPTPAQAEWLADLLARVRLARETGSC